MFKAAAAALSLTLAAGAGAVGQPAPAPWTDPSPHAVRFVTVSRGVHLELLDWGGTGRPVLLLAGSGHTAHVFDDVAPTLTDCCHVYGLTRRGHGQSSRPSSGYEEQQLADDVLQAVDAARLERPVLIGHSIAGGEMTTIARQHPDRLSGLIYLDAIGDLEDDPMADPQWVALQRQLPAGLLPQPACDPIDRGSFAAYRRTSSCVRGFAFPEAELRQMFESRNGAVGPARAPAWVGQAIAEGQAVRRDYARVGVPVLAIVNGARTAEEMLAASGYKPASEAERDVIDRFTARSGVLFGRAAEKLTRPVPGARIVYLPLAGHYLFLTREAETLREIRAFVARLN
jgi:pimeloyl-ACP methyl ester carboxylesterase